MALQLHFVSACRVLSPRPHGTVVSNSVLHVVSIICGMCTCVRCMAHVVSCSVAQVFFLTGTDEHGEKIATNAVSCMRCIRVAVALCGPSISLVIRRSGLCGVLNRLNLVNVRIRVSHTRNGSGYCVAVGYAALALFR
jgi:hypothetical protein